jgi:hypothetical protein
VKSIVLALLLATVVVPAAPQNTKPPSDVDSLVAPIALYPDQLLSQILISAGDPASVQKLAAWMKTNSKLKGTELQDAAVVAGFEPSFVALTLFPTVVNAMAEKIEWTTLLGRIFQVDKSVVFASIQKLRAQAQAAGNLKTSQQQTVETKTTSSGDNVIVIEPSNPQVVYVPQYNSTTVYVHEDNSADAAAAAAIGFTAGIVIGAAVNNSYYYGPYGWHGGAYMYNDAWDDYYDAREDAREDWQDHREDLAEERGDRAENAREQRTERNENRSDTRSDRAENRSESGRTGTGAQAAAQSGTRSERTTNRAQTHSGSSGTATAGERSGTRSDAFSGYSSGKSERAASSRGKQSRSSSGSRSRSGGGGRRR